MLSEGSESAAQAGWEGSEALGLGAGNPQPCSQLREANPVVSASSLDLDGGRVIESGVCTLSGSESGCKGAPALLGRLECVSGSQLIMDSGSNF